MESKDIIKALEYRAKAGCEVCDIKDKFCCENCHVTLMKNALKLIKNQQAEIEKLKGNRHCSTCKYSDLRADQQPCIICAGHNKYEPSLKQNNIKTEAYKEIFNKLRKGLKWLPLTVMNERFITEGQINDLEKELTERKEDEK